MLRVYNSVIDIIAHGAPIVKRFGAFFIFTEIFQKALQKGQKCGIIHNNYG